MAIAEMYGAPFRLALAAEEADRRAANDRFRMEMAQEANQRERERWEMEKKNAPAVQELAALTLQNQIDAARRQGDVNAYLADMDNPMRRLRYGLQVSPEEETKLAAGLFGKVDAPDYAPPDMRQYAMEQPETEDDKRWLRGFRLTREAQRQAAARAARGSRWTGMGKADAAAAVAMYGDIYLPLLKKQYPDMSKDEMNVMLTSACLKHAAITADPGYQKMSPEDRAQVPQRIIGGNGAQGDEFNAEYYTGRYGSYYTKLDNDAKTRLHNAAKNALVHLLDGVDYSDKGKWARMTLTQKLAKIPPDQARGFAHKYWKEWNQALEDADLPSGLKYIPPGIEILWNKEKSQLEHVLEKVTTARRKEFPKWSAKWDKWPEGKDVEFKDKHVVRDSEPYKYVMTGRFGFHQEKNPSYRPSTGEERAFDTRFMKYVGDERILRSRLKQLNDNLQKLSMKSYQK